VLLRPLVNRDEDRLVYIRQTAPGLGVENATFSVPELQDLRDRVKTLSKVGDFSTIGFTLVGLGEPREVRAGVVGSSAAWPPGLRLEGRVGSVAASDLAGWHQEVLSADAVRNRQFEPTVIVTCVRWYLRFRWLYLFRAVDSGGQTLEAFLSETRDRAAAKMFLKRGLGNPDNRAPHVFARDGLRSYPAAIRELQGEGQLNRCRQRTRRYCNNRIESDHHHIKRRLRAMQGPRTKGTEWAVIQGIDSYTPATGRASTAELATLPYMSNVIL
jgi:transposase-like protein